MSSELGLFFLCTCVADTSGGGVGIFGVGSSLWRLPSWEDLGRFLPRMSIYRVVLLNMHFSVFFLFYCVAFNG